MIERVLITVKTYPTLSRKYAELVCTAGVNEDGEWRRLYPIRFRQLFDSQQYRKYQWVEAELARSTMDARPETYRVSEASLKILGEPLSTAHGWRARREAFLDRVEVFDDLTDLIKRAHDDELSLAAFRPRRFVRFVSSGLAERDWDPGRLAKLEDDRRQLNLFADEETVQHQFRVVRKLPYRFAYRFEDVTGRSSELMIEDWEIGALYWNCLARSSGEESAAVEGVRQTYWDKFVESGRHEVTLILGTTLEHHRKRAPNPFVIVGVVYPPVVAQSSLF